MNTILEKNFFFIRHAETDWNRLKLCQGQKNIPLNKKGYQEAKNFASEYSNLKIDCIISSPLCRALDTAKEIHCVHPSAKFQIIPELSERYWGTLEGMSSEEMYAIEISEENDPSYLPGNNIESRLIFRERVSLGISLAQSYHSSPLIVSHGRVFVELCHILGIPPLRQIPNCKLIEISPSKGFWEANIMEK